jgi:hypothetical protein
MSLKPTKCICEVNNIFKILMPFLHVSASYMRHPQGAQSSWPQRETPSDPGNRESSAGIRHETRQSDSNIGSTRKQEEENRTQRSVIEEPPSPPPPKIREDLACNTNIRESYGSVVDSIDVNLEWYRSIVLRYTFRIAWWWPNKGRNM